MAGSVTIDDRPDRSRYELSTDGALAGFVTYRLEPGRLTFNHTEVDPAFAGRGFGSHLAAYVLDDARKRGLGVIVRCPFIARYLRSHPEYSDVVIPSANH